MTGLLERIAAHKRQEVAAARAVVSLEEMRAQAGGAEPARDFAGALRGGFALIAEIKPASPLTGRLRDLESSDAARLARRYVSGGARALSVLTDERFFGGGADHLRAARTAVAVPVLRKDFVLGPYQLYESRAMGADAVLLIAALLEPDVLRTLVSLCHELGMDALVEVHTEREIDAARAAGARLMGINNRDLHTFAVDLETTTRLRAHIPPGVLVVSESGIRGPADIARLKPHVDAVLVGTALMTSDDPAAAVRALLNGGMG
ncbi:MAG: indole-3-glycerol phosphate synthase TrpC [Armatimonadetes bacterium]|nr:indole-3-glycerol phosphate synthase TrpC [Armatimonadota bacterium]